MHRLGKYLIVLCLLLAAISAAAQKRGSRIQKKSLIKVDTEHSAISFNEILPATAHLIFIDSIVVSKDKFIQYIPLPSDCGAIKQTPYIFNLKNKSNTNSYAYINEFGDLCFYNDSTPNGHSKLFTADKLACKWQKTRLINEFGDDYEDVNYPYLMPDGVTLYFSAINKKNSLGGRDIYVTRLNTDSMTFYKPENLGLPYNSMSNDYCCIIDDKNSIGWLVTDRRQAAGKVCIYTFIPSDERWAEIVPDMQQKKLESLARITKISDTWIDKKAVADAKIRLAELNTANSAIGNKQSNIFFVVNDKTIYTNVSQFKSAASKKMYIENESLKVSLKADIDKLTSLRKKYSVSSESAKKSIRDTIIKLENDCEKKEIEIKKLDKKIRNAENLM